MTLEECEVLAKDVHCKFVEFKVDEEGMLNVNMLHNLKINCFKLMLL